MKTTIRILMAAAFCSAAFAQYVPRAGAGSGDALVANPLSQFAATTSAQFAGVITNETGTGVVVLATSPALVTPNLGTPSAITLTNADGLVLTAGVTGTLPAANGGTGITSLGSGVATFLGTPSGSNLASALTTALPATKGGTGLTALGTNVATALGNAINDASGLVALDGTYKLPAVDGSQLTNLASGAPGLPVSTFTAGAITSGKFGTDDAQIEDTTQIVIHFTPKYNTGGIYSAAMFDNFANGARVFFTSASGVVCAFDVSGQTDDGTKVTLNASLACAQTGSWSGDYQIAIVPKVNGLPTPVADGTYTVGLGGSQNGTITVTSGIVTAVQEAQP